MTAYQTYNKDTSSKSPASAQLADTLIELGFKVEQAGGLQDNKPWLGHRGCGPYIWLWSHEGKKKLEESWSVGDDNGTRRADINDSITISNLRDRERLLNLLGEFYSNRKSQINVRLVVSDMAVGSSMLKSQGSDVMGLPENIDAHSDWCKKSEQEMIDFSNFLRNRTAQKPIDE